MHFRFGHIFVAAFLTCLVSGCASNNTQASNAPSTPMSNSSTTNPTAPSSSNASLANPASPDKPSGSSPNTSPNKNTSSTVSPTVPGGEKQGAIVPNAKWTVSNVPAATVAKNADDMILSLRNVEAKIEYAMSTKVGKAGGILKERIGDADNYALEYPVMTFDKRRGLMPAVSYARANGKVVSERTNDLSRDKPIGSPGKTPTNLTDVWLTNGARELFAGLLDKRVPFSEYVAALSDPKNGYKTTVMERTLSYEGRNIKQYEIQALKLHGDPKIGGGSSVSLIFDGKLHLPVTLTVNRQDPGSSMPNGISMDIQWQSNVKMDRNEFQPLATPEKASR